MSPHFQLNEASHSFGSTKALLEVSLSIAPGEKVALIGPSGSGKTTLLRLLGSQIEPSAGQVKVFDEDPHNLSPSALRALRSEIGYLPQSLGLVPNLRVLQNVLNGRIGKRNLWATLRSLISPAKTDTEEVFHLLKRVGIAEKLYDRTDSLSGGQQQRVAIARALFQNAKTVLADEPVSAIDPIRSRDTIELLSSLSEENGFSLVVSLHDLELARQHFPRLIGLREGRVLFDSAPEDLPASAYDQLFQVQSEPTT